MPDPGRIGGRAAAVVCERRVQYATVEPGQPYVQPTFVTHPWVAVNAAGACLAVAIAQSNDNEHVVGAVDAEARYCTSIGLNFVAAAYQQHNIAAAAVREPVALRASSDALTVWESAYLKCAPGPAKDYTGAYVDAWKAQVHYLRGDD